jgi:hypothetical protein
MPTPVAYYTLENKYRAIKKEALQLKAEVENGKRGEVVRTKSTPATPRKPKTPKDTLTSQCMSWLCCPYTDNLPAVANGRVSKSSPSKKTGVKQETIDSNMSSFANTSFDIDTTSFDAGDFHFGDEVDFT